MTAPKHFAERRHKWALYDDDEGRLIGHIFKPINGVDTCLWDTRADADASMRSFGIKGLRIVKVRVSYEVIG